MTDHMPDRAPETCTLPAAEQPARLVEFDQLFAASLRAHGRPTRTRLWWHLDPDSETTVRDLTARESSCCSFFTFSVTLTDHHLLVEVGVTPQHVDVLDALQARATAVMA